MTPSLRQLRIFVAVADAGSTAAAAERVALSQSAASAALKELEDGLGIALFDRIGRRLRLNAAGRALLDEARAVLDGVIAAHSVAGRPAYRDVLPGVFGR